MFEAVLFELEYAHAMDAIKAALVAEALRLSDSTSKFNICCADVMCSALDPCNGQMSSNGHVGILDGLSSGCETSNTKPNTSYRIGGLTWSLPYSQRMEEYLLFWIGSDNPAFANLVLTFNGCEIVRHDPMEHCLETDVSPKTRILKRRYYLVEKAKDANIVGIWVATLGVGAFLTDFNVSCLGITLSLTYMVLDIS